MEYRQTLVTCSHVRISNVTEVSFAVIQSDSTKRSLGFTIAEVNFGIIRISFTIKELGFSVTQLCYDMLNDTRPFPKGAIDVSLLFIRMFLVYNEETGRFQTGRHYPTLILVSLSTVDETKVKLEAVGMPSVIFEVPNCSKNASEAVQCTMWWGEPVKCIDCGTEPAEWLSRSIFSSAFPISSMNFNFSFPFRDKFIFKTRITNLTLTYHRY